MRRTGKFLFGVLLFIALGYLLVYVTKAQPQNDRRFALVNQARAIVVIVYADEVTQNESSGAFGFYRGGELVAMLPASSGLAVREMFAADVPGKDEKQ